MLPFILLFAVLAVAPVHAQTCRPARTALVLSGGGAKGLAHIGVLRVLDSLGIRPDLVVGSSMGAIVGGMYASGYSGREIDSLARALPIADLFRTYQPQAPRSLGVLQPLVVWEQGDRRFNLQSAGVSETEVNALVNAAMLRGNLLARGNFDSLPIPFRAVAADLADRSAVVLVSGDLARAVRASFAIPLVFAPESLNGRILADGGLVANIPVAVARAAGAERVIVSDATERLVDSTDLYSPIVLADRLLGFLFQQPADSLLAGDVLVRPAVEGFTGLNFSAPNVDALIRRGTAAANTVLPRAHCLPMGPHPSAPALPTRIGTVTIATKNPSERLALERLLGLGLSDTLDLSLLRSRVRQLARVEAYRAVWLAPTGSGDSVSFHVSVHRSPRRVAGLGVAYDNELGGRMWVGAVDRRFLDLALEASTALYLGEFRKELYLGFRRNFQFGRQLMTPTLSARLANESVRRFNTDGHELDPIEIREGLGFLGIERAFDPDWLVAVGGLGHAWHEPGQDRSTMGATARVEKTSRSRGRLLQADLLWTALYSRAGFDGEASMKIGPVRIRPELRLGWGDRLPPQATFPLGGEDGFPGLHIGERRGDREALLRLLFTYVLKGPFVGRIEVATGRSALGGPFLDSDGWIVGARAGVGAETPVGPVRFEYGVASGGRGAVFIRLGRWF
ncbi:MAG TPA: patatin-like phospholipase family protein [Gemmatimonadales bacterium]|jgi:NTE family protein|nr:patatin-like phospholipase family protein [Gemmatimonadales bacterium]